MKDRTFTFYMDPGHGWLRVKRRDLVALGIEGDISHYSYQRGDWCYLEEDCDASRFIAAFRARYGCAPTLTERYSYGSSTIRQYEDYRPLTRGIPTTFREECCGGAFDGFAVTSDADPGL